MSAPRPATPAAGRVPILRPPDRRPVGLSHPQRLQRAAQPRHPAGEPRRGIPAVVRRAVDQRQYGDRPALRLRAAGHHRLWGELDAVPRLEPDRLAHQRPAGADGAAAGRPGDHHAERAGIRLCHRPVGRRDRDHRRQPRVDGRQSQRPQDRPDGEALPEGEPHRHRQLHQERHRRSGGELSRDHVSRSRTPSRAGSSATPRASSSSSTTGR